MFNDTKYLCLKCYHKGLLDFDYSLDQHSTFASFSGDIKCESCKSSIRCYGLLDIVEGQPVHDYMDWLMEIDYDGEFDMFFVKTDEI